MLKNWNELPEYMRTDEVRPYYDLLQKKRLSLFFKRVFDIIVSLIMIILWVAFSIDKKELLNMVEYLESLSLGQW